MSLRLKSGKFYDDAGNVVPLEHGNAEQFNILEKHRKRRDSFAGDGLKLDPDIKYRAEISFSCACDEARIDMHAEGIDELDAEEMLVGMVDSCPRCKQKYELWNDENGNVVAKFKK